MRGYNAKNLCRVENFINFMFTFGIHKINKYKRVYQK